MGNLGLSVMAGCLAAALIWWPGIPEAATYQLQVASVSERVFMYFVEGRTLPGAEAFLDDSRRSRFVLFRDRRPQMLEAMVPGRSVPAAVTVQIPKRNNPWGATIWDGEAGQLAVFRIRGIQSDHQKLKRVALQTGGGLVRLPLHGVPGARSQPMPVPAKASGYLTRALESGTFAAWVERHAMSHQGLSVVVGRHHSPRESDTVYLVIRMPQTERTYKVLLGWKTVKREGAYAITPGRRN